MGNRFKQKFNSSLYLSKFIRLSAFCFFLTIFDTHARRYKRKLHTNNSSELIYELISKLKGLVYVSILNALYGSTFVANITKISSFKNITFVKDSSFSKIGSNRTFSITFDSLGEPSCASVYFTVGSISSKPVSYGTSASYCSTQYPNIPFMSVFNQFNNTLTFDMLMYINGVASIIFKIKNDIEIKKMTTAVTVSNYNSNLCRKPILNIRNRANDFLNPQIIERSKTFSVVGLTILDCRISLKNLKQWKVHFINPNDGSFIKYKDLSTISSSASAEVLIPSNFLDYGTYRFIYQVTMIGDINSLPEAIDSFIEIIPTGIAVFPFSGGIKELTIGRGQSIELDPGRYSYDFDDLLIGTQLDYKFFCRIVIDGLPQNFLTDSFNNYIDIRCIRTKSIA